MGQPFQSGGALQPGAPVNFYASDASNFVTNPTVGGTSTSAGTSTLVDTAGTQTLTNKTITAPVLSGTATGTYTLGGTPTITAPTISSPAITGTPVINTVKGNFSASTVSASYGSDTYLVGSSIGIPTGGWIAGGRYYCTFDMVKTGAGTAQFAINLRLGAAGTTSDASIIQWQFAAGTANADTGTFEVWATFRTVGSGTSAVMVGTAYCTHALAATGLISTGASGAGQITTVSSGFDSTTANNILGLSVNGGASFSGTNTIVQAEYHSF